MPKETSVSVNTILLNINLYSKQIIMIDLSIHKVYNIVYAGLHD